MNSVDALVAEIGIPRWVVGSVRAGSSRAALVRSFHEQGLRVQHIGKHTVVADKPTEPGVEIVLVFDEDELEYMTFVPNR